MNKDCNSRMFGVPPDMVTEIIEVRQEDIDRGVRGACNQCPVALAIRRTLPGIRAMADSLRLDLTPNYFVWTPSVARRFILDYDRGQPVHPFSFPLEIPAQLKEI